MDISNWRMSKFPKIPVQIDRGWGSLEPSLWIGKVYGAESEIYSCHEQNLQNTRKNHGPFQMNFNSRAMTTKLLTILFATCSVAFTPFLYFSTLLL